MGSIASVVFVVLTCMVGFAQVDLQPRVERILLASNLVALTEGNQRKVRNEFYEPKKKGGVQ